ncbi:MAG: outer membrane beta-barrel family protein [Bacteroidota bacterium]
MRITGNVQDTTSGTMLPLPNALAMLVRIKDSVLIDFRRTDSNGNFAFTNLTIDTLQLVVSHPKFGDNSYYMFGSQANHEFDIKRIILPQKSQKLNEVVIYAYKDPVYYKGDTLVYVADSFQVKPNAVVEDLLKKLPGIKVNADGSIESQGKEIQQVLVDGDEFFGADPTMATKNLAANGVQTVEIYEKKDENATDDSETIQVMDLRLKDEAKKGYFGKVSGASDFGATRGKPFYEGELLANKFNKTQKISVFALGSNTMKSSLDWQDMYKYGLGEGGGYNEEEDNWSWNFNNSQGDGIPTTLKTGVYFNQQLNKKMELNVNYTYSNNTLKTSETNRSQYFLTDTSYVTDLENTTDNKNQSHEMNMKFEYKIDSLSTLEIEPKAKLNSSNSTSLDNTNFLFEDLALSRNTAVTNKNDAEGTTFSTRVSYRKNFKKKGRKLTTNYRFNFDKNQSSGNLSILDLNYVSPIFNDTADQSKENKSLSTSHTAGISYIEPLNKKVKLELEYEYFSNFNDQEKFTRDFENGSYSKVDSTLSNSFESVKSYNRGGTQLIYDYKKLRLSGGVRFRNVLVENRNLILDTTINQNINNVLPRARFTYKFSQNNRLNINYNTSSSQPSINQLQPVRDNTNPNRLVIGNPNLKPNFVHNISANYNFYKALSGTHMWTAINHMVTNNAFANATSFDNAGRITSQTINVDGNTNSSFNIGGGFPMFKKFLEVFPSLNGGISKSKSYIDSAENIATNKSFGAGMEIRIERDSLEFSIGGDFDYTAPSNTISAQSSLPYFSQNYDARLLWKMPKGFIFETEATYAINSNRAASYNLNVFIWNAGISKSFLKTENLIAKLQVYDILNQNISTYRDVSSNVITDTKSVIIARYFMVRLTYKFNNNKIKEDDGDFF